jgi:hypothetical protein
VKELNPEGFQGDKEWLVSVISLYLFLNLTIIYIRKIHAGAAFNLFLNLTIVTHIRIIHADLWLM